MSDQQQASQQFEIQKIYLKDVSLETPNSPMIFTEQWQPQTEVRLETGAKPLAEGLFEVSLTVTITAKWEKLLENVDRDDEAALAELAMQEIYNKLAPDYGIR